MNANLGVQLHKYGLHIFKNLINGFSTINLKMRNGQLLFVTSSKSIYHDKHVVVNLFLSRAMDGCELVGGTLRRL